MSEQQITEQTKVKRYSRLLRERRKLQVVSYIAVIILGGILAREWYFPATFMLIYFFLWLVRTKDDFSRLELGDRMYFMGYTFTLISLGYVLFDPIKHAGTLDAFYYFGTAIFTSIIGLIIRSGLHLFYRHPEQQVDEINAKITAVGDKIINDLEAFSHRLESQFTTLAEGNIAKINDWQASLASVIANQKAKINDLLTAMNNATTTSTERFLDQLSQNLQQLIQSLRDHQTTILQDLLNHQNLLQAEFTNLTSALTSQTKRTRDETQDTLSKLLANYKEVTQALESVSEIHKGSTTKLRENLQQVLKHTSTTIESLSGQVNKLLEDLHSKTDKAVRASASTYDAINSNLNNTKQLTEGLNSTVKGLLDAISQDSTAESIATLISQFGKNIQEANNASTTLTKVLQDISKTASDAQAVSTIVDDIRNTVKRKLDAEFIRK
jgi:ElaB/YqjD/DUF883 family membrane-anchored ribosome-binding protein